MTDVYEQVDPSSVGLITAPPEPHTNPRPEKGRYDRSIVEGPLRSAVWKIAWPTMLTNIIGGLQGIVDHVAGRPSRRLQRECRDRRGVADLHRCHCLHHFAVHRHERAGGPLCRRRRGRQGQPHGLSGVSHSGRHLAADNGAARVFPVAIVARSGQRRTRSEGGSAAVPAHHVPLQQRHAHFLHAERRAALRWRCAHADDHSASQ